MTLAASCILVGLALTMLAKLRFERRQQHLAADILTSVGMGEVGVGLGIIGLRVFVGSPWFVPPLWLSLGQSALFVGLGLVWWRLTTEFVPDEKADKKGAAHA